MKSPLILNGLISIMAVLQTVQSNQKDLQRETPSMPLYFANFLLHNESYLGVAVLSRSSVNKHEGCLVECLDTLSCFSINVASTPDSSSKYWCELLSTDKYNSSSADKFLPNSSSHHFSIKNSCSSSPCLHGGQCQALYNEGTHICQGCSPGYVGTNCERSCVGTLGMQDGRIANAQITASSIWGEHHEAWRARLHQYVSGTNAGAWCARQNRVDEWLQIDLGRAMIVTKAATQGRPAHGQWISRYTIAYSMDGATWAVYGQGGAVKEFSGNSDMNTVVSHILAEPIHTRFIRIIAKAWHNHVSLRAELYGCTPS